DELPQDTDGLLGLIDREPHGETRVVIDRKKSHPQGFGQRAAAVMQQTLRSLRVIRSHRFPPWVLVRSPGEIHRQQEEASARMNRLRVRPSVGALILPSDLTVRSGPPKRQR